jgi:hypothetical protein
MKVEKKEKEGVTGRLEIESEEQKEGEDMANHF